MDLILLFIIKLVIAVINALPLPCRLRLIEGLVRLFFFLAPKHARIARKNLSIAFPAKSSSEREQIFKGSLRAFARMIVDFLRLPMLSREWMLEHFECPYFERFQELHRQNPGRGIVIATGHLGSFELLAHYAAVRGSPLAFVVRNAALPHIDQWWQKIRESNGNKIISRSGAMREILKELGKGTDVGILFDQNVKAQHAVFVDWFGKKAATTRSVAIGAIKTEAPVVVAAVRYLGDERYRIEAADFDFTAIYHDESLSMDEKVIRITQQLSDKYVEFINLAPQEWFWMHRRWRTRPEGDSAAY